MSELWVTTLGQVPYADAAALQERLRAARQDDAIPDVLLLLEHPPVYTRGRRATAADLPRGESWYRDQGIDIHDSDRGGQVTYHGPGQLVGYPILRIGSVRRYVEDLEAALIAALADEGIAARVPDKLTGVWAGDAKIASIGIHVSRHVTMHGFAVNVDNDLAPFDWVSACGVPGARMTSIAREKEELGIGAASMSCFRKRAAHRLTERLGRRQRLVTPPRLLAAAGIGPGDLPPARPFASPANCDTPSQAATP
ncbi:MAG: lipoyl(octanoyl) transferase LipB [Solirubrobacterales bacterium]|nr:lipoyl(octanoyl) transferase LipB [Solirubrobacterales bacterium]